MSKDDLAGHFIRQAWRPHTSLPTPHHKRGRICAVTGHTDYFMTLEGEKGSQPALHVPFCDISLSFKIQISLYVLKLFIVPLPAVSSSRVCLCAQVHTWPCLWGAQRRTL